jgi:hypothetical protein
MRPVSQLQQRQTNAQGGPLAGDAEFAAKQAVPRLYRVPGLVGKEGATRKPCEESSPQSRGVAFPCPSAQTSASFAMRALNRRGGRNPQA